MAVATLAPELSLDTLHEELLYTSVRLANQPLTKQLAPAVDKQLDLLIAVRKEEQLLREARVRAQAAVDGADAILDGLVDEIALNLQLADGNSRNSPTYKQYFGTKTVSAFKKPILGEELESMRAWGPWLADRAEKPLQKLSIRLVAAVKAGDDAAAAKASSEDDIRSFRLTGSRKQWVDQTNALRASTWGELGRIAHESNLPTGFADSFFRHEAKPAKKSAPTMETVNARIADLSAQLQEANADLTALTKAAEDDASERAKLAEIDAAQKAFAEAAARLEAAKKK